MPDPSALFVTTIALTLEAFLLPLADALRERGWRVDALASGAEARAGIESHFDNRFDATWTRNIASLGNYLGMPRRVRELVAGNGYDIVHVHTPIASLVSRWALRSHPHDGRPQVIYTAHGFHFYAGGGAIANAAYRSAERSAARWTDYLVTMNSEDFEAARAFGTISDDRIRSIPGVGVDPTAYRSSDEEGLRVRRELSIPPSAFVITMIAEMNANKRHALVLDAFARTRRTDAFLVLVGDGPKQAELRATADRLGIASRVRFAGHRPDVPSILAASDVVTLASMREGLPRVILEAMAAGVAVIGTPTRGLVDLVGDDEAGWIATSDDAPSLAEAFDHAADNPDETRMQGSRGHELVVERYSQPAITASYLDLYDEALAQIR